MQKMSQIGGGKQPPKEQSRAESKIGISNFNDGISCYSSHKDLYNANTLRPHHKKDQIEDSDHDEYEKTVWESIKSKQKPMLNGIGTCVKYLILGVIYPFYFTFFLAPKFIGSNFLKALAKIKPGFESFKKWNRKKKLALI